MSEMKLPAHLSYSQVGSMLHCGEQWRLSRGLHLPESPAWALVGGSAVHKASEFIDWDQETDPTQAFINAFDDCITAEVDKAPDEFKDPNGWRASGRASKAWPNKEDESWWRANGPLFVGNWITWRRNSPLEIWRDDDGKLAVELEATVTIAGMPVKVFIDRVMTGPQGLVVVDLKSGQPPKDGMQLAIYAHALNQVYGMDVQWGQYWMARDGASTVSYAVSEWPMERLAYIFAGVRAMQEQNIFIPKRSPMCVSCGVRRYCLAFGGELAHEVPQLWSVPNNVSGATNTFTSIKANSEYGYNKDFDAHYDENDNGPVEALLLGHAVAKVADDHLLLDDGTLLKLVGNDGGCACSAGCYDLIALNGVENIITAVQFEDAPDDDGDENGGTYRIFVFAGNERINLATFEGSDGNGYYGTGYHVMVRLPSATNSVSEETN